MAKSVSIPLLLMFGLMQAACGTLPMRIQPTMAALPAQVTTTEGAFDDDGSVTTPPQLRPGTVLDYQDAGSTAASTGPASSAESGITRFTVLDGGAGFLRVRHVGPYGPEPDEMVPLNHPYVPQSEIDLTVASRDLAAGVREVVTVKAGTFETRRIRLQRAGGTVTAWFAGNTLIKLISNKPNAVNAKDPFTFTLQLAYYRMTNQ